MDLKSGCFEGNKVKNYWPLRSFRWMALLLVAAIMGCAGGPPKHPAWNNATGAEQFERLMWQSMQNKDWKEVERHLAPMFTGVTAEGQALDRNGWIEYWKQAQVKDFNLGELTMQPAGADMVVTYDVRFNDGVTGRVPPANGV